MSRGKQTRKRAARICGSAQPKDNGKPKSKPLLSITDTLLRWTSERTKKTGTKQELWDRSVPGFGAQVTGREASFLFRYYFEGEERQLSLGHWSEERPVQQARKEAAAAAQLLARGVDPEAERGRRGASELLRSFAVAASPATLGLSEEALPTLLELYCGEGASIEAFTQWREAIALLEQIAGAGKDLDSKQRRDTLNALAGAEKAILEALRLAVSSGPSLHCALGELREELHTIRKTPAPCRNSALRYGQAALALHAIVVARWPDAPYLTVADYIYGFLETEQAEKVLGRRPPKGRGDSTSIKRNGLRKARTRAFDQITSGKCPLEIFGAINRGEHPLSAPWGILIRQRRGMHRSIL